MKFSELPKTGRSCRILELENGIAESVTLGDDEHGGLTGFVFVKFSNGGCGFGGYRLGLLSGGNSKGNKDYAAEWIVRCMGVFGVSQWEKIEGKPLRCLHEGLGGSIVAIGHYLKDDWFCPRQEWGS